MLHSRTRDAVFFQIGLAVFLTLILLIILIPFWRVIVPAFSPLDIYTRDGVPFFLSPTQWTAEAFKQLLGHSVRPGRVPGDASFEPHGLSDDLSQFTDSVVFSAAYVEMRDTSVRARMAVLAI